MTGQLSLGTLNIVKEANGLNSLRKEADDLAVNQKFMHSLSYSRSGELAAAGNIDGEVNLYDMKTRQFRARFASKYRKTNNFVKYKKDPLYKAGIFIP